MEAAVDGSSVVILMSTEETPYIQSEWIRPDSLCSAVSLLDPKLGVIINSDFIVVDDESICFHEGRPLQRLDEQGKLDWQKLYSIGELIEKNINLRGRKSGAKIFFNPMGTVLTDFAVALNVLKRAHETDQAQLLDV